MAHFLTLPFALSRLEAPTISPGTIVLCRCPGLRGGDQAMHPGNPVALDRDLGTIIDGGASILISLIGSEERERLGVSALPARAVEMGLDWQEFAITDRTAPDHERLSEFTGLMRYVSAALSDEKIIAVHCQAGIGRTGLVAASTLIWCGMAPDDAIVAVRRTRPGAIETAGQQAFVRSFKVTG